MTFLIFLALLVKVCFVEEIIESEVKLDGSSDVRCNDTTAHETAALYETTRDHNINQQPAIHPHSLTVIFENKYGTKVNLYWDDGKDGILQSVLTFPETVTINTYIGHKFYFTLPDKPKEKLYNVVMQKHIDSVVLYTPNEMKKRDEKFEKEKSEWMKDYYQKKGITWKNYYPRPPVVHYKYNITHIGQKFHVKTNAHHVKLCPDNVVTKEMEDEFLAQQNEWEEKNKDKELKGEESIPPFFHTYTDKYFIMWYNNTKYCQIISPDEQDSEYELEVLCNRPELILINNFLSEEECDHIINLGTKIGLKRSTVSEEALVTSDRTSQTLWLNRDLSLILDIIIKRIANIVNINNKLLYLNASSESLQLVHYFKTELYKSHFDYGTEQPNNRYITFLMYLNDVIKGGQTSFPSASKQCTDVMNKDSRFKTEQGHFGYNPGKGNVMFFYNLYKDGNVDTTTLHYAEPVLEGEKWMSNLWIWDPVFSGSS